MPILDHRERHFVSLTWPLYGKSGNDSFCPSLFTCGEGMVVTMARGLSKVFPGSCMRPSSLGIDDTFQQTQLFAGWRWRHIQEGPDASGLSDKWKMKNVMIERDGDVVLTYQ